MNKTKLLPPHQKEIDLLTRRKMLKQSAALGISLFSLPLLNGCAAGAQAAKETIATTQTGRVRGKYQGGVHSFKGIPYGAPTGGDARFMPASKPASWSGVRDAYQYGPISPQDFKASWGITEQTPESLSVKDWTAQYEALLNSNAHEGEDCLALNI